MKAKSFQRVRGPRRYATRTKTCSVLGRRKLEPWSSVARTSTTYMDWGKTVLYKLERGEGECAV